MQQEEKFGIDPLQQHATRLCLNSINTYLNVLPYLVDIISIVSEPLVDRGDATLTPRVIVTNKVRAVLVNGIISEVHTLLTLHVHGKVAKKNIS